MLRHKRRFVRPASRAGRQHRACDPADPHTELAPADLHQRQTEIAVPLQRIHRQVEVRVENQWDLIHFAHLLAVTVISIRAEPASLATPTVVRAGRGSRK